MHNTPNMNRPNSRAYLITLLVFAAALNPLSAWSQTVANPSSQATKEETYTLSPFTVTENNTTGYYDQNTLIGSRTAKALVDIPASIAIINRELLDDLGAVGIQQAVEYGVSGVTANLQYDDFNIRGFRTAGNLRNGVPVRSLKGQNMYDIERIEVIKGPAAMLTGVNDALGGTINLVSRKPTAKFQSKAKLTFGDHEYMRGELHVSGPLFKSNNIDLMYRLSLGGTQADTHKDWDNIDQTFIGGAFLAYLGKDKTSSITVNWFVFDDDSFLYISDFLDLRSTRYAQLNQYSTSSFSPSRQKDNFYFSKEKFVDVEYLTKLTDNSDLRMLYVHADADSTSRIIRGITLAADNYTLARQDIPIDIMQKSHTLQLDYLHRFRHKLFSNNLTLGADYRRQSQGQDQIVLAVPSIDTRAPNFAPDDTAIIPISRIPAWTSASRSVSDAFSYYVQDNISFWQDRISLAGGLRWIDSTSHGQNLVNGTRSETKNPQFKTHKYGALFKVAPTMSVYYTNAENLYLQSGFTNEEIPQLRKNQAGQLDEFGIKINRKLTEKIQAFGTLAYFDMALTNVEVVTGEFNSRGDLIKRQSAQNTSKGWEVDFGTKIQLGNGYFDSIVTYYSADTLDATTNLPSKDSVEEAYSVMGKYTWSSGLLKGTMIGAGMYDQGSKLVATYLIDIPSTYNIFAAYRLNRQWRAQLNLNNIRNKRFVTGYAANGLVSATPGFNWRGTVEFAW